MRTGVVSVPVATVLDRRRVRWRGRCGGCDPRIGSNCRYIRDGRGRSLSGRPVPERTDVSVCTEAAQGFGSRGTGEIRLETGVPGFQSDEEVSTPLRRHGGWSPVCAWVRGVVCPSVCGSGVFWYPSVYGSGVSRCRGLHGLGLRCVCVDQGCYGPGVCEGQGYYGVGARGEVEPVTGTTPRE